MRKRTVTWAGIGAVAAGAVGAHMAKRSIAKINKRVVGAMKEETPPSFFQDLGWRDMDRLVIGSTKAWEYLRRPDEEDGVYPLVFFESSPWVHYSLLRCYYGHLAEGGLSILVVDPAERIPERRVSPLDARTVHELLFRAEGGGLSERQERWPAVCYPGWCRRFMAAKSAKDAGSFEARTWTSSPSHGEWRPSDYVSLMANFCRQRGLRFRVIVLAAEDEAIRGKLASEGVQDAVFCPDAASLNANVFPAPGIQGEPSTD